MKSLLPLKSGVVATHGYAGVVMALSGVLPTVVACVGVFNRACDQSFCANGACVDQRHDDACRCLSRALAYWSKRRRGRDACLGGCQKDGCQKDGARWSDFKAVCWQPSTIVAIGITPSTGSRRAVDNSGGRPSGAHELGARQWSED